MASVANCPHCFLQLAIPDEVDRLARGQCPTCHKEFELAEVVFRPIPEVVVLERTTASAATLPEIEAAEHELLRGMNEVMLRAAGTMAEVPELGGARSGAEEAKTQAEVDAEVAASSAARMPTLAELMSQNEPEQDELSVRGPSFDLPNVPLVRENGATVEFDAVTDLGAATSTEFELDGVDFETLPPEQARFEADQTAANEPEFSGVEAESARFSADELPDASIVVGAPRPRRRRSAARMFVGTVLGGVAGLAIGYYILLRLLGPSGDFLEVAKYLPAGVLPNSFSRPAAPPLAEAPIEPVRELRQPTMLQPVEENENIPAGYVASVEPAQPDDLATAHAPSYEPSQFDDPLAAPLPQGLTAKAEIANTETIDAAPVAPFPLAGPSYTSEQLAAALEAAELAQPGLVDGDLVDTSVRRTKGLSYAKLCDLAHAVVFVDQAAASPADVELRNRVLHFFASTLAAPHTRDEVARISAIWIDSPHRRHGGVFLSGTLSGGQIAGDVYEYELETPDGNLYSVLSSQPIDAADASDVPVAIVGTIVDRPTTDVAGYTGTAAPAIFSACAQPLE